jgi:hypothetical protein
MGFDDLPGLSSENKEQNGGVSPWLKFVSTMIGVAATVVTIYLGVAHLLEESTLRAKAETDSAKVQVRGECCTSGV